MKRIYIYIFVAISCLVTEVESREFRTDIKLLRKLTGQ